MDEVAEIKQRLEITEVVSAYVPLKQAGKNLKANCPFHNEKSASFTVSPDRGIFHCFGCQESGDIFTFVMKIEGLEFREALEKLAQQAGVELKARRGESKAVSDLKDRLLEAHGLAAKYFQASLVQNHKALEYVIRKRGLKKDTVRDFQIGYAPDSWNALTDFLGKRGFTYKEMLEGGLAGQKEGRSTVYDLFRGRITFPICDRDGRVIGFTARVLGDEVPKYLNTPQTPLYDKSHAIFGLHLAKAAIRERDEVVLVEGNMDVVASHQAGVKQVVAASGTALTLDQLRSLSKLTKNIKLAFDADRAGLAATERAIELGQKLGLNLRMVVISGAKDADELIATDPAAWGRAIAEARYIVDYLFERFESDYDLTTAIGKRQYADRLAASLRRLGDPVEQGHYIKLLATKLSIDEDSVRQKLEQADELEAAATEKNRKLQVARTEAARRNTPPTDRIQPPAGPRAQGRPGAARSAASAVSGAYGGSDDDAPPIEAYDNYGPEPDSSDDGRWEQFGGAESQSLRPSPIPQASARQKPAVRIQLEEALLSLVLTYPLTRACFDDLTVETFSSPQRQALFTAINSDRDRPGNDLVAALTEVTDYGNVLMLRGEQEFADLAPADRSFEAFELARRLQITSNNARKQALKDQLTAAQKEGNVELEISLLTKLQAIIAEEV